MADRMKARELLEAMDARHEVRLAAGNIGEWQTELNEVRRLLHYLLDPPRVEYPEIQEPDDY